MQHHLLSIPQEFSKLTKQAAKRLVPLYKLHTPLEPFATKQMEEERENSSSVCYACMKGLREGFEEEVR